MLLALLFFRTNPPIFYRCLYVQITMIKSMLSYFLESCLKDKIAENRQTLELCIFENTRKFCEQLLLKPLNVKTFNLG